VIREVRVAEYVYANATERFGESRSPVGAPSEYDFVGGPLAAAVFAFRDFDHLRFDVVSAVRTYMVVDPFFGAVVFVGVLLARWKSATLPTIPTTGRWCPTIPGDMCDTSAGGYLTEQP
jgi:hypothetical protein